MRRCRDDLRNIEDVVDGAPALNDCSACLGYGHFGGDGKRSLDRRDRKCLDCNGTGRGENESAKGFVSWEEAIARHRPLTAAQHAVLETIALADALGPRNTGVRLSNRTDGSRDAPWRIRVHSRVARRLEELGLIQIDLVELWPGLIDELASLTDAGRERIAKAEGK